MIYPASFLHIYNAIIFRLFYHIAFLATVPSHYRALISIPQFILVITFSRHNVCVENSICARLLVGARFYWPTAPNDSMQLHRIAPSDLRVACARVMHLGSSIIGTISRFLGIALSRALRTRYQNPISVREIATIDNLNEEREDPRTENFISQVQSHCGVTSSLLFIIIVVIPMFAD